MSEFSDLLKKVKTNLHNNLLNVLDPILLAFNSCAEDKETVRFNELGSEAIRP